MRENEELKKALESMEGRLARIEELLSGKATAGRDVMRMSELVKAGYNRNELLRIWRLEKGVAWQSGKARNSPVYFDVPKLKKVLAAKTAPGRRR